jgi:hypothetical protein
LPFLPGDAVFLRVTPEEGNEGDTTDMRTTIAQSRRSTYFGQWPR